MAGEHIYECEVRQWHEDETTRKHARRWVVISVEEALQLGEHRSSRAKAHSGSDFSLRMGRCQLTNAELSAEP